MNKMGCLMAIVSAVVIYGISWALTVGLIKLVCICLGLVFSLKVATGIWIVLCILKSFFGSSSK